MVGLIGGGFLTKLVEVGAGQHLSCLPHGQIYPVFKWSLLAQVCNVLGIGLVKISVCLCVLRIVDRARRRLSQFLWILIAVVAVSHLVQAIIFLIQCRPLNALWNPKVKGTCFPLHTAYTAGYVNYGETWSMAAWMFHRLMCLWFRLGRTDGSYMCHHSSLGDPPTANELEDQSCFEHLDEFRRRVS